MPASNAAAPVLELRDVSKSFGPVVALRSGSLRVEAGSIHALVGENGAGKSTLVKVVAGVHRRDSGTFELGGERRRLLLHGRVQEVGRRGDLPGADALPGPLGHREHLHGPPDPRLGPAHRPRGDVRRGGAALRPARGADRPPPSRRGPLDRRPADHRDRQGHLARRPAARHGRADRRAERRRGRPAVRRRPQPARRGPRAGLHLPPLRRGLRPRRHRHRHARRLLHRHQDDRRDHAVRAGLADGRPRRRRPVPQGGRRDRRAGPAGARPQPRRRLPRHRPRGPRRRDRRTGRPGRRRAQRGRTSGLRRRLLRLRVGLGVRQAGQGQGPALRDPRRAWRSSPRTAASRASSSTPR